MGPVGSFTKRAARRPPSISCLPGRWLTPPSPRSMALLVLLARAAGAGVVAPHLGLAASRRSAAGAGLRPWAAPRARSAAAAARCWRTRCSITCSSVIGSKRKSFWTMSSSTRSLHHLEEVEALLLVLLERIPLAVAAQADPLLEVIEGQEVVLPGGVDDCSMMARSKPRRTSSGWRALLLGVALLDRRRRAPRSARRCRARRASCRRRRC